jgi:hypothetical protein
VSCQRRSQPNSSWRGTALLLQPAPECSRRRRSIWQLQFSSLWEQWQQQQQAVLQQMQLQQALLDDGRPVLLLLQATVRVLEMLMVQWRWIQMCYPRANSSSSSSTTMRTTLKRLSYSSHVRRGSPQQAAMTASQQQQQQQHPHWCLLGHLQCYSRCDRPHLLQLQQQLSRLPCRSSCWRAGSRAGCQRAAVNALLASLHLLLAQALPCGSSGSSSSLSQ